MVINSSKVHRVLTSVLLLILSSLIVLFLTQGTVSLSVPKLTGDTVHDQCFSLVCSPAFENYESCLNSKGTDEDYSAYCDLCARYSGCFQPSPLFCKTFICERFPVYEDCFAKSDPSLCEYCFSTDSCLNVVNPDNSDSDKFIVPASDIKLSGEVTVNLDKFASKARDLLKNSFDEDSLYAAKNDVKSILPKADYLISNIKKLYDKYPEDPSISINYKKSLESYNSLQNSYNEIDKNLKNLVSYRFEDQKTKANWEDKRIADSSDNLKKATDSLKKITENIKSINIKPNGEIDDFSAKVVSVDDCLYPVQRVAFSDNVYYDIYGLQRETLEANGVRYVEYSACENIREKLKFELDNVAEVGAPSVSLDSSNQEPEIIQDNSQVVQDSSSVDFPASSFNIDSREIKIKNAETNSQVALVSYSINSNDLTPNVEISFSPVLVEESSCKNNLVDLNEDGIDCGGNCPACKDLIKSSFPWPLWTFFFLLVVFLFYLSPINSLVN